MIMTRARLGLFWMAWAMTSSRVCSTHVSQKRLESSIIVTGWIAGSAPQRRQLDLNLPPMLAKIGALATRP